MIAYLAIGFCANVTHIWIFVHLHTFILKLFLTYFQCTNYVAHAYHISCEKQAAYLLRIHLKKKLQNHRKIQLKIWYLQGFLVKPI